jgi:hypothetical protein
VGSFGLPFANHTSDALAESQASPQAALNRLQQLGMTAA